MNPVEGFPFDEAVEGLEAEGELAESQGTFRADADKISADGSEIGLSIVTWVAPPHFFRSGKVLAL